MKLHQWKISTLLILGFSSLALVIVLIGGVAFTKSKKLGASIERVIDTRYPQVVLALNVRDDINQAARSMRDMLILTNFTALSEEAAFVGAKNKQSDENLEKLRSLITEDAGKAVLAKVLERDARYRELQAIFLQYMSDRQIDDGKGLLLSDMPNVQNDLLKSLDELAAYQDKQMQNVREVALGDMVSALQVSVISMAVGLTAVVITALFIIRSVTHPIRHAVSVAQSVAHGHLDMHFEAHQDGRNETSLLLRALKDMQSSLLHLVTQVRQGADNVSNASVEIAQGNLDLSNRTENHANALQSTTSSMQDLGARIVENAGNAHQANLLALNALTIAAKGGSVVGQVVETMQGINESSRRIAAIIQVIDGIAFQTNILALNAAVEAARAGEQGRGFAVVASEVRALAGRSSDAAKEIKELISASVDRVAMGTVLVDNAGSTMTEVANSIQQVAQVIGSINVASNQQSIDVQQVVDVLTQMDRVTQQNAALVEQMTASTASLSGQAADLVSAISQFRLSPLTGAGTYRPQLSLQSV